MTLERNRVTAVFLQEARALRTLTISSIAGCPSRMLLWICRCGPRHTL